MDDIKPRQTEESENAQSTNDDALLQPGEALPDKTVLDDDHAKTMFDANPDGQGTANDADMPAKTPSDEDKPRRSKLERFSKHPAGNAIRVSSDEVVAQATSAQSIEPSEDNGLYDLKSLLQKLPSSAAYTHVNRKKADASTSDDEPSEARTHSDPNDAVSAPQPSTRASADDEPSATPASVKTSYSPATQHHQHTPEDKKDDDVHDASINNDDVHDASMNDAAETTHDDTPSSEDDDDMLEEDDLRPETAAPPQMPAYDGRAFSQALMSGGRAFSHAVMHVGGTRQRAGRFWMIVIGMLILMALLVVLAHYKHREIKLGYELSTAISEREALLEENRKLRIELRVQSSRDRLEPMASRQLGLTQIRPEQILFLKQNADNVPNTDNVDTTKRLDGLDRVRLVEDK